MARYWSPTAHVPEPLLAGVDVLHRGLEFLAFWSAIALVVAYPAVLATPSSRLSIELAVLLTIHAAGLLLGHDYE